MSKLVDESPTRPTRLTRPTPIIIGLGFVLRAGQRLMVGRVGHVGRVGLCLQRVAWCFAQGRGWAVIVNGGALR